MNKWLKRCFTKKKKRELFLWEHSSIFCETSSFIIYLPILLIYKKKIYIYCLNIRRKVFQFSSVQSLSRVRLFATPWIAARQAYLSITNARSSLRLTSIQSVMPSGHLILCRPLLLLPPIPPSIRVFSKSQLFEWGGQRTGVSALASFLPRKSQGWKASWWRWKRRVKKLA